MTNAATKTITAAIVLFALASAFMAAPAHAVTAFPADLYKAATSQTNHQNATSNCEQSRFGCTFARR